MFFFFELPTNLFSKGNSCPVDSIGKFPSQLYVTTQPRRAISSRRLFQRLNPSRVVLRMNTYRAENLVTHPRRVVRANHSESIVRPSEVYSTLKDRQREVLVTPDVNDYATPIVWKN